MNYDIFVSYSRCDDRNGWVTALVDALQREHAAATAGSLLRIFFDRSEIKTMADWEQRIREGLHSSRLLLACLSPNYLASEWCRREWQLYLEQELDQGLSGEGIAPIYLVGSAECDEKITDCSRNISHRQYLDLRPFFLEGPNALQRKEIRIALAALDQEIAVRIDSARRAERSPTTIPPHNRDFVGRTEELRLLRQTLFGGRIGVIAAVHGLGGIGKSALAFEYAHATASDYPGGRWLLPCEDFSDLREALRPLRRLLGFEQTAEEASDMEKGFVRLCTEILSRERMLLLLDNVNESKLLSPAFVSRLPCDHVHLLVTTRLAPNEIPGENKSCFPLDELPPADALRLLEKHRPFVNDTERAAAQDIAGILGGFALAVEATGVFLRAETTVDYSGVLERLRSEGFTGVEGIAARDTIALSRHREKLLSATLAPSLDLLTSSERAALQFAALLLPDGIPIPWLKDLISTDFPDSVRAAKPGYPDPWISAARRLDGMCFFVPAGHPNLRRMHRMVQHYLMSVDIQRDERTRKIDPMVAARAKRLEATWNKPENRWEIQPLKAWARRGIRPTSVEEDDESSITDRVIQTLFLQNANELWDAQPEYCNANIGQLCTSLGHAEEALCHIREARLFLNLAIRLWERCVQPMDPQLALAYADLAALEYNLGNGWYGWGSDEGKRALQLLDGISEIEPRFLVSCFNKLSLISELPKIERINLLKRAGPFLAQGLGDLYQGLVDGKDILPFIQASLSWAMIEPTENSDKVRAGMKLVLERVQLIQDSPIEPWKALAFRSIAIADKAEGNFVSAYENLVQAIELQETLFEPQHSELGESYAALAEVEEALGHMAEARTRWAAAATIGMAVWFPWGQLEKWTSWNQKAAKAEQACGHLDAARALLEKVITAFVGLQALGSTNAKSDPTLMHTYVALADIEAEEGKLEDAKTCLQKANEIAIQRYGQDHAETKQIVQQLCQLG